ncbi:MAG: IS110 family transposase [Chloroflexi bacterium]|nr:IS110 family transposase [Chloroflexota bacterium]
MRYLGLDVHKRVVQACTLDEGGRTLHALRFDLTRDTLTEFARRHLDDDCAVALEATTNTWAIVDVLTPFCPRIVVSNPMRTKAIASAKIKTDKVDAEVLAQLLRCDYLPTVWTPDAQTREQRALASRRSALTRQAISLKNRIHSVLHQRLIFGPAELFSTKGLAWLRSTELPPIARGEIDTLLRLLDALQIEQASLRVDVDRAAFASQDIKLLMTLPGIDATTAHAIMAAIGDIHRFRSPDRLAAYFGLVPSVHQSAEHAYHGRITKQGNSNVRWLLIQAAQIAGRHPGPLGKQFATLARRKNRNVAVVAIAHKLAILAWHLLTRGAPYRYALPRTIETKLARLRVSQKGRRTTGPTKGQPRPANYGTGIGTRRKKALDAALQDEQLPPTAPAPAGETRVLSELKLRAFAEGLQYETRVPRRRAHATAAPEG